MQVFLTTLAALYVLVGMIVANRETKNMPGRTREQRHDRELQFLITVVIWPKSVWDDICQTLGL